MKKITLPKELLNLPQPWASTHPEQRRQQLRSLSDDTKSIKTALNVLERSLHSLSQLTLSKTDCIPEDMITYWGFTAEWLALSIPTLDEFKLTKIEEFLISEQRIDSPSPGGASHKIYLPDSYSPYIITGLLFFWTLATKDR